MQIDGFSVRDFRKLAGGVAVEGLEAGITVIVGDNEEGKSTLLKALQSAFFDRYKLGGKAVDDMMPFGAKGVRPTVEVGFGLGETRYRLVKSFARNSAVMLEGGGQKWQADAAEERLREVLGFQPPGAGAAKEKHRGLAGLLWVEQGRAFQALDMNADTQAALRDAIEGEVGQVLGGERGKRLLAAAEKRASAFFTPTGLPRKSLKEPNDRLQALKGECQALEAELEAYDDKVHRLGRLQESLARYRRGDSLARAREAVEQAEAAVRRLGAVEGRVETARARMEQAEAAAAAADDARRRRAALAGEAAAAARQAREAEAVLKRLDPEYLDAERGLAEADSLLAAACRLRDEANAGWEAARRTRERAELRADLQLLDTRLRQAEALGERLDREQQALARNPVDENGVAGLRKLHSEQIGLRAALETAAATLVFSPEAGQRVTRNGRPVDVSRPARVTGNSIFRLQDFGAVEVHPGGRDLARLRADCSELENRLQDGLRRLDLADLAGAEAALRARQAVQAQVGSLQGELKGVAPDGLERLREAVRERQGRLSDLAGPAQGDAPDVETAKAIEQAALRQREAAGRAADRALQDREAARVQHGRLREARIKADVERTQRAETAAERRVALEEARLEAADEALAARAGRADQAREQRRAEYEALLAAREALNPEAVHIERERAGQAHDRLRERIENSERDEHGLAVELRTLGQKGLAEELEKKKGERDIARSGLARIETDAKAWKLLLDTLREAEREAKETFLGPVRERLQPYLRILFPETELRLREDDLEIISLRRAGVEEPFASLSIGAREQVAVLTRLALADLLRENGRPVALILDDPLVNSDDERFRRMVLALMKAARTLQILILTCHEARYETLGARIIRLADCRAER